MITRDIAPRLLRSATKWPAITVTGPRQSGKTTLCRALFPRHSYVTLEDSDERAFATDDPGAFLARFADGAILDEVQRVPDLLSQLQGVIDEDPTPGRWILSGSQNLALLETVSQSLAGRTQLHHLLPLTAGEVASFGRPPLSLDEALFAGGYPRIFDRALDPADWLGAYVATYVERDVRTIRNIGDLTTFRRFVELCAGRTGQLLNHSSLAADCGVSQPTAKAWLSTLEASFLVFCLPPFHAKLRKRLVKMPKLYFLDTGLACWLLGIRQVEQLRSHPLRGSLFETWVVSEAWKHRANQGLTDGLSFYRDSNGAEADLVIDRRSGLTLVEAKSSGAASSRLFDGARRVRRHLEPLSRPCDLAVAYGGDQFQQRSEGRLVPWRMLRSASLAGRAVVMVLARGRPVAGAEVLALFPNHTWQRAVAGEHGEAVLDLHSTHEPMTVFVAAEGLSAHLVRDWIPAERALSVELDVLADGGAVIFPEGAGEVPGLTGRLSPTRDSLDRTYLYTDNVAVNGTRQEPHSFAPGEELRLTDADGQERRVRILDVVGRSALLEYRQPAS